MKNRYDFLYNLLDSRWIRTLNKAMMFIVAALAVLLVLDLFFVSPKKTWMQKMSEEASLQERAGAHLKTPQIIPVEEPFETYASRLSGPGIFGPAPVQKKGVSTAGSLNNLSLVGIIQGAHPQAILEDKTTQMNYYLSKDQTVNGVTLEQIQEKKVVLKCNGETVTLEI